MAEFEVRPEDYQEGGRLWMRPDLVVISPEGVKPVEDPATGIAYIPGSRAVEVTQTEKGFQNLPQNIKDVLFGKGVTNPVGYNPFASAEGYLFDEKTGQVIIQNSPGNFSFLGARYKRDESGEIVPDREKTLDIRASQGAIVTRDSDSAQNIPVNAPTTGYTGSGTTNDPLRLNGVPFTGAYQGQNFVSGISNVSAAARAERQSAYDALLLEFNKYGLGSLVKTVQSLIEKDVPPSQFLIELRNSPEYQQRFSANTERLKKGLSALSEAEYIRNEDNYRQILRTYGLTQFDNDAYVNQFLVNDVSPQELGERVVTAVNQIQMADPAITSTLKRFYGLTNSDMIGVILDPKTQLPQIQRTIAAAGIGTAAGRQGLNIGRDVAEQLAAQGVTQQEAQRGYATIAEILPTAEKLSDIYGEELGRYGLPEAEQEVFNQLASAQRRRQRLVERERAAFAGESGLGRTSLTQQTGGQI